jgi:hypothetical protein
MANVQQQILVIKIFTFCNNMLLELILLHIFLNILNRWITLCILFLAIWALLEHSYNSIAAFLALVSSAFASSAYFWAKAKSLAYILKSIYTCNSDCFIKFNCETASYYASLAAVSWMYLMDFAIDEQGLQGGAQSH